MRLVLVFSGPDLDTDAYGHALAGRRMLETPLDLRIHWVWLPLIHVVYAVMTAGGLGLLGVRLLNVAVAASVPWLLFGLLRTALPGPRGDSAGSERPGEAERELISWLAPVLVALEPISVYLGSSGQPEPIFTALVLGASWAFAKRRGALMGGLLAAAALVRYEGWLLPFAFALVALLERRRWRDVLWLALPALTIAAWVGLQYWSAGEPLHFLRLNAEFVVASRKSLGEGPPPWERALWYLYFVPARHLFGGGFLVAAFGVGALWRRPLLPLTVPLITVLGFLSYGFVTQKHLGLDRHAMVLVPLYAVAMASGTAHLTGLFARGVGVHAGWTRGGGVALLLSVLTLSELAPRALYWVRDVRSFEPHLAKAAAVLAHADAPRVYCDLGVAEVLSNLPPQRFLRFRLNDVSVWQLEQDLRTFPAVWAVSKRERLAHLVGAGRVIWEGGGVVVVRFEREPPERP
jgi:hypothetical protein